MIRLQAAERGIQRLEQMLFGIVVIRPSVRIEGNAALGLQNQLIAQAGIFGKGLADDALHQAFRLTVAVGGVHKIGAVFQVVFKHGGHFLGGQAVKAHCSLNDGRNGNLVLAQKDRFHSASSLRLMVRFSQHRQSYRR